MPIGADTAATAVLPWLFRRLVCAPESTPRRLVYVLPAHSLPEHVFARIGGWLDRLGRAGEVGVHLLAGAVRDSGWLRHPERTAILVGAHDLLLSRALMRGFADSRRTAPVAYGLLHNDAQWVFDTAHLLGPGLPTSVLMQRMRDALGTSAPTATLWMSSAQDTTDTIIGKLLPAADIGYLAQTVVAAHVVGTQTAVVLGSAARARALHVALRAATPERDVVLIHPYFRSADRLDRLAVLGERDRDRIIVGTRALEVGMNLSPRTLITELRPGDSGVRQLDDDSEAPGRTWGEADLLALFDTAVDPPDLDVGSWVCEPADRTALVAWRAWESGEPTEEETDPGSDELCPVPLDELRRVLDGRAWLRDRRDGLWRRATAEDLEPGVLIMLDARCGGYLPDQGWSPDGTVPVPTLVPAPDPPAFACVEWVSLDQHLTETEDEARKLVDALPGLPESQQEAVILAARYHDLGKCHEVFQEMLRSGGGDPPDVLLAKSKAPYSTGRSSRPGFRHELVSALMLAHGNHWHGDRTDHRLVTYLVAAHHGKVRISVRTEADEAPAILGVLDGDRTPAFTLSSGETFPAQSLQTADFRPEAGGAWAEQARALRDRSDLGPFRLAYLEALVRIADWRSSARHDGPVEVPL
ncbi:CRISPR-associated endonuclease Cas3'' [Catenulispora subtropica]|uniref:HD Cas3-type domain-containing protein n=1 Tax=Catenulispora subtropica TaxID=450798 RepID=A0ABP5D8T0_9ACTN